MSHPEFVESAFASFFNLIANGEAILHPTKVRDVSCLSKNQKTINMTYRKEANLKGNPLNSIIGIILMIMFLIGLWFLAKFIFKLLFYLSPIMLIAAFVIDKKVVTGYFQWIYRLFKKNPAYGVGATVLSIIGIPVVSTFLLGKALFKKKIRDIESQQRNIREGELVDYEELDSEPLQLPKIEPEIIKPGKKQAPNKDTTYEDLFE